MQIAIYARVSPTKKKQGDELAYSIEQQLTKCRKQAEIDNIEIFREYYDEYTSGKAQEYMKQFNLMIEHAKQNKFSKIYCLRVDRFGRNLQQMINTQKELQQLNIDIKFIEQSLDTSTTFGRMIMGIMASVAEWQRETIIVNTKIGRDIALQKYPEKFGRPKANINWNIVKRLVSAKDDKGMLFSWTYIANQVGVTTATLIRRYRKEYGELPKRRF